MNAEVKYLVKLKEIKASLLKEVRELDLTINQISSKNSVNLNYIANQETIGIFDYKLCASEEEKVSFALNRLGRSDLETIAKFLIILGENKKNSSVSKLVEIGIQILMEKNLLREVIINNKRNFILHQKVAFKK